MNDNEHGVVVQVMMGRDVEMYVREMLRKDMRGKRET